MTTDARVTEQPAATVSVEVDPKMPVPFEDEHAECMWYFPLHLSDQHAVVAVALYMLSEGVHDRDEAFDCAADATVERVWFRDDPDDEYRERMVLCAADEPGAQAFTRVAGVS